MPGQNQISQNIVRGRRRASYGEVAQRMRVMRLFVRPVVGKPYGMIASRVNLEPYVGVL